MGAGSTKERAMQIPIGSDDQSIQGRKALFKSFDSDANNMISIQEFKKGLHDKLGLPNLFDTIPLVIRSYGVALSKVKEESPADP